MSTDHNMISRQVMEEIDESIKKIDINKHFPKLTGDQFTTFLLGLKKNIVQNSGDTFDYCDEEENLKKTFLMFSGSFMEGAPFARMLNPTLKKKYIEFEFDTMFPMGRVVENRTSEVVEDLAYAKGFAWLKYSEDTIELDLQNNQPISDFLIKQQQANKINENLNDEDVCGESVYLNSKAFKESIEKDLLGMKPDMSYLSKYQENIQGPSSNVDIVVLFKQMREEMKTLTKKSLQEGCQVVNKLLTFVNVVAGSLEDAQKNILKMFSTFRNEKKMLISQLDIEEFQGKLFPVSRTNGQPQNELLHLHWSLLAFINEMIMCIVWIESKLHHARLEKLLGIWQVSFVVLLRHSIKLKEELIKYIIHLCTLPQKMNSLNLSSVEDTAEIFMCETISKIPIEVEIVLKTFRRCMMILPTRLTIMRGLACHFKENSPVNIIEQDEFCLNIDRVPAIFVQELPEIAAEFRTRTRLWPSVSVMNTIFKGGFHLVPKPSSEKELSSDLLDWRWSFSGAEMILANARSDAMDTSYLIFKSFIYRFFKCHTVDEKSIPSYFAKTTMMILCEKHLEEWWMKTSICDCVLTLLEDFKSSFERRFLPHYFICDLNLFDGIPDELIDFGRAVLESICQDPLPCILEVVNLVQKSTKNKITEDNERNRDKKGTEDKKGTKDNEEAFQTDKSFPEECGGGLTSDNRINNDNPMLKIFGRNGSASAIKEETSKVPLLIAQFRVTLKYKEEEFKDLPDMQGILKISNDIYENITTDLYKKEFEMSKSIQPVYDPAWKISFKLSFMSRIEDELERTNIFEFSFRGSTGINFSFNQTG